MKTHLTLQLFFLALCLSILTGTTKVYAQPSNDLIENATHLNFGPESPYTEDNVQFSEATNTNDHTPQSGCGVSQEGIWYKFTATKNGNVAAGILSPNGAAVIFFEGPENATNGMQLLYVDQNTNPCALSPLSNIDVTAGTTYYLYMRNITDSNISINTVGAFAKPENDSIASATGVNGLTNYSENDIHFLMATNSDNGQSGCDSGNVETIWYKFTAQNDGEVIATATSNSGSDAMIFYTAPDENATDGSSLIHVNQSTNPCDVSNTGTSSILTTQGTTYYLLLYSADPYVDLSINFSDILSVSNNTIEGFSHYPNPVHETLYINAPATIDEVRIFNVLGQKVFSQNLGATQGAIQLSGLKSGIYILNVTSEGTTASYKIIKK